MQSYDQLFNLRGSAYDRAMRRFPDARKEEFNQAIERARLIAGMRVADVPAGGGYLARYLPAGCEWLGHEPCGSFHAHEGQRDGANSALPSVPLLPLPWSDDSIDVALSIAGIHHLEDKCAFFQELWRVVKPTGRVVISDVSVNSPVAAFLDGFVGDHNSTGHEGVFISESTVEELNQCGWRILSSEVVRFHWCFDTGENMAAFCHDLFDVRAASIEETAHAIGEQLGVDCLPGNRRGMRWELMTVVAEKS